MNRRIASSLLSALLFIVGCGGGAGDSDGEPSIAGWWSFNETLSDPGVGVVCTDQGTWTFAQSGASFSGQDNQTGTCVYSDGTEVDNTGPEQITGTVGSDALTFTEIGAIPCVYDSTGSVGGATLGGTISCAGEVNATVYNLSGSWTATKQ